MSTSRRSGTLLSSVKNVTYPLSINTRKTIDHLKGKVTLKYFTRCKIFLFVTFLFTIYYFFLYL